MADVKMEIPLHVLEDLEDIRKEGKFNMMAGSDVLAELHEQERYETVLWLADIKSERVHLDRNKYVQALSELGNLRDLANKITADD